MRKLRDFRCPLGHEFEALVPDGVKEMNCRGHNCPMPAKRQLSAPAGSGNAAHGFMGKSK